MTHPSASFKSSGVKVALLTIQKNELKQYIHNVINEWFFRLELLLTQPKVAQAYMQNPKAEHSFFWIVKKERMGLIWRKKF